MSKDILNLDPKPLWKHFYSLTQIPRPSKKEAAVIKFVKEFGESLGLETIVDEVDNVIIKKPATPGMENRKGIILQGHLDMVPQANSGSNFDFEKDPIDAYVDGDWVTANGTTLGADNGMGVAAAMAVLESKDLVHGPVEALFTIDEETGMTGAFGLKSGLLDGDILLNMDSEDEGELYVGCAGGTNANIRFEYTEEAAPTGFSAFRLSVSGLKGGHSGIDIPLERGNSNILLFRFLYEASQKRSVLISSISGGSLRNAIPRESFAIIMLANDEVSRMKEELANYEKDVQSELSSADPGVQLTLEEVDQPSGVMDGNTTSKLIKAIYACPNGVVRMSMDMEGLVETSTNLAIVKTNNSGVDIQCLLRSSVDSAREDLKNKFVCVFELAGAKIGFDGEYPGWKPNMDSPILKASQKVYQDMYGTIPEIRAIHAGLECGLLGGVYPNWDMLSFGPTIRFPHSPDEKVNIETVVKFWDFLVEILKNAPKK
ncbi:MAG: aminoacyl-histidine dipeptidase [Bacteroidota bacterium]|nr:aminoacyl-histidine dipeptidase [Bacteroidota bacterium]